MNTKIRQVEEDFQKWLDQHKLELVVGLQSALTALQQCNLSLVIPSNIFDFLLSDQSSGDAGSTLDRTSHEHAPLSSTMHNLSQVLLLLT